MIARSSPAVLSGINSSSRHRDNVTASVCFHSLTTGMPVHHMQTELLLASTGLCVYPAVSQHLEKGGHSEDDSQANGPFSLLMVMRWI